MQEHTPPTSDISRHLGKSSQYACFYDPTLLVRELRQNNRTHLNIDADNLPFVGNDTWNGYEVTALTDNGLPIFCVIKFVYPCNNPYIVESKSVKLYFNSFSMTKMGETRQAALAKLREYAAKDLSELLECDVKVDFFENVELLQDSELTSSDIEWQHNASQYPSKGGYITIEDDYPVEDVVFDTYTENPTLLKVIDTEAYGEMYHSALLRSRCRITAQPDSGDIYINIKGKKTVDPISLLQYIVSFRDECHFHEEICEAVYMRLWNLLQPDELVVKCLYARRGSWDINPERASSEELLHYTLSNELYGHIKTPRQ